MEVKNDKNVLSELALDLDIIINTVTASFNVKCELNLKLIPQKFVKKHSSPNVLALKLKNIKSTVILRSTGKCAIMGAESEENAFLAAQHAVNLLNLWGFQSVLDDFKINNIWGYCLLPWRIQIEAMVAKHKNIFVYEPEICNQCTIKLKNSKTFAFVLASGYVKIAASNREEIGNAVTELLSFAYEFRI